MTRAEKTKWKYYKTARLISGGEYAFVHLDKYHRNGNFYDITTIEGEKLRAFTSEMDRYCL